VSTLKLSENVMLIQLSAETQVGKELSEVNKTLTDGCDCHVLIDFSRVEMITSANISNLMIMDGLVRDSRHRLILYNVALPTKCIFKVVGLEEHFNFAEDREDALSKTESTS
jgi:anti-anti-sigma regulatory factor